MPSQMAILHSFAVTGPGSGNRGRGQASSSCSATCHTASTHANLTAPSPAFVREPEGNGCAERFIRVLKENLLWVQHFATIEELRLALIAFKQTYNQTWIIERHGYKTPAHVRADQIGRMPMAA